MNNRCPNCKQEIKIGKGQLIDCPMCERKILSVIIGGVNNLIDVTPKEELKK